MGGCPLRGGGGVVTKIMDVQGEWGQQNGHIWTRGGGVLKFSILVDVICVWPPGGRQVLDGDSTNSTCSPGTGRTAVATPNQAVHLTK